MKKITVVAGTRPEIIKVAPLIHQLSKQFEVEFITTGQHEEMAKDALGVFSLIPNFEFNLMQNRQSPSGFISSALEKLGKHFENYKTDLVLAQGDTASTFSASLSALHSRTPFAHIEAGLRTNNLYSPFPEEAYRAMVSRVASYHFCPTKTAVANLKIEGITENVFLCGNTVVDALKFVMNKVQLGELSPSAEVENILAENKDKKIVFVTGHRRENHFKPLTVLCSAIKQVANIREDVHFIFPVHLNPVVSEAAYNSLSGVDNISLTTPIDYVSTLTVLSRSQLVISDSGGIQEEAPYFQTYLLVTRTETERPEVIREKLGELVPLIDVDSLSNKILDTLENTPKVTEQNPFGDGTSAKQIEEILLRIKSRGLN